MARRFTAHDLADYACCPRAWWYERHQHYARLDPDALDELLRNRRSALGRRASRDPEVRVLQRLLGRQQRFAGGRAAHRGDAERTLRPRPSGCLLIGTVLLLFALTPLLLALR